MESRRKDKDQEGLQHRADVLQPRPDWRSNSDHPDLSLHRRTRRTRRPRPFQADPEDVKNVRDPSPAPDARVTQGLTSTCRPVAPASC